MLFLGLLWLMKGLAIIKIKKRLVFFKLHLQAANISSVFKSFKECVTNTTSVKLYSYCKKYWFEFDKDLSMAIWNASLAIQIDLIMKS